MKTILNIAALCTLAASLMACVHMRPATGYVPAAIEGGDGYSIKEVKDNTYFSIYRGNNRTKTTDVVAYTMLAGYEFCGKRNLSALVTTPENFSQKSTYTHVSSYSTPIYGKNGAVSYIPNTYSYPVTTVYPQFLSVVTCR